MAKELMDYPCVYVWLSDRETRSVGHASLRLDEDHYLSWWPDDSKKKLKRMWTSEAIGVSSLNEDLDRMKRKPDKTHWIFVGLNHELCLSRWNELVAYAPYELPGNNCCWVVYEVLRKGGAPYSSISVWTPSDLHQYMTAWDRNTRPVLTHTGTVSDPFKS